MNVAYVLFQSRMAGILKVIYKNLSMVIEHFFQNHQTFINIPVFITPLPDEFLLASLYSIIYQHSYMSMNFLL